MGFGGAVQWRDVFDENCEGALEHSPIAVKARLVAPLSQIVDCDGAADGSLALVLITEERIKCSENSVCFYYPPRRRRSEAKQRVDKRVVIVETGRSG